MGLSILKACEALPVSLIEAKVFLRIDTDEEDFLLHTLIETAAQSVEAYTSCALLTQTWRFTTTGSHALRLSDLGYVSEGIRHSSSNRTTGIELPKTPFKGLVGNPIVCRELPGIEEENHENIEGNVAQRYRLDTSSRTARLHVKDTIFDEISYLLVDFVAGYGDEPEDIPAPLRQGILGAVAQLYEHRATSNDNRFMPVALNDSVLQLINPYKLMRLG
ncbi:MAG: hypothetical protein GY915_08595 [bacterium]|nr:hypothetical protein [bacterium]